MSSQNSSRDNRGPGRGDARCYYQHTSQVRHQSTSEGGFMLWTIVVILVILWLLGALGTVSLPILTGNTVHVLLVIVIVIVLIQVLQGRRL
jgi:uncharacterized protein with PQ loop repeat